MPEPEWRFSQMFGEREPVEELNDADVISTVEFDTTGDFFSSGDNGGRIVLFQRVYSGSGSRGSSHEYRFYTEFQSHEPDFDYLKSLDIEEKINKIKWLKPVQGAQFILSTNDKTIKLAKVYEKKVQQLLQTNNPMPTPGYGLPHIKSLRVPQLKTSDYVTTTYTRRIYANAHHYNINAISPNSDNETYISSDDLRINMWHYDRPDVSFNIVDIRPDDMEELTDVITAAEFHPEKCNLFMYSTSRGCIHLGDLRTSALCDNSSAMFNDAKEERDTGGLFADMVDSISDARFSRDGNCIVARDYMSVKTWDVRMSDHPLKTFKIHEYLRPFLDSLYDDDYIFDKFECTFSGDGKHLLTGGYHNFLHIISPETGQDVCVEASKNPPPKRRPTQRNKLSLRRPSLKTNRAESKKKAGEEQQQIDVNGIDFNHKVLHVAWHPTENLFGVAGLTNLFFYRGV